MYSESVTSDQSHAIPFQQLNSRESSGFGMLRTHGMIGTVKGGGESYNDLFLTCETWLKYNHLRISVEGMFLSSTI